MSLKSIFLAPAHLLFLALGWLLYAFNGRTLGRAHQAMVFFFCLTGGRSNDWMSWVVGLSRKRLTIENASGVLGDLGADKANLIVSELGEKGYVTFDRALPAEVCERLMQFALATPASVRRMDEEQEVHGARMARIDLKCPLAVRYDYGAEVLLANAEVQKLLADESLLAVAQMYLGSLPKADVLSMWWHTNYHGRPDSEAAQYFHFDLDRLKWLKVFVYLTDVGPADGPHTFVSGSHTSGGIPGEFLRRGYIRFGDDEVLAHYGPARQIEFSAPRGTIIIEDTRGLHKGKPVSGRSRLILQLQFSNCLFGGQYPKAVMTPPFVPQLAKVLSQSPAVYGNFL